MSGLKPGDKVIAALSAVVIGSDKESNLALLEAPAGARVIATVYVAIEVTFSAGYLYGDIGSPYS